MLKIVGPQLAARLAEVKRQEAGLAELRIRVNQEVTALETLRDQLTTQLSCARQAVANTLQQVQQTALEHPEVVQSVPLQRDNRTGTASMAAHLAQNRAEEHRHPTRS